MKERLFVFVLFSTLMVLQTSFFAHFRVFGIKPNLIVIAVLLMNIIEPPAQKSGVFYAVLAGFFWDIFSSPPFGLHILALTLASLLIKEVIARYIAIPAGRA